MPRICRAILAAASLAATMSVVADEPKVRSNDLPTAAEFSAKILPDMDGVVSWKTLTQVEAVKQGSKMVPRFSKQILALDKQQVKVRGFVLPMDIGDQQRHFLISAVPPHCEFCLPAGPDAVVEVRAVKPIKYGVEPVMVSGKLWVLKDDPTGILYRLTQAEPIAAQPK